MSSKNNKCLLGRISGDQFSILCPKNLSLEDYMIKKFQHLVNLYPLDFNITLRFGIYHIEDLSQPVSVMCDRAKMAADSIKGIYGVRYAFYDDDVRKRIMKERSLTDNIKQALDEQQFKIYIQPKFQISTGEIIGGEALVRWESPKNGFMTPAEFLPLFEKNGFISDLDIYVWNKTCEIIRGWRNIGIDVPTISVNVSRSDIYNMNISKTILGIVKKYDLEPNNLQLEITETSYTKNPKQLIAAVQNLKQLGFQLAMDDFGAGYSSLNMLSELPIDVIKLDMGFMESSSLKSTGGNILSFIISLAKWLDLSVIAEGVETDEQAQMLLTMGCKYAQGHYYSKPVTPTKFARLLRSRSAHLSGETPSQNMDTKSKEIVYIDSNDEKVSPLQSCLKDEYSVVFIKSSNIDDIILRLRSMRFQISAILVCESIESPDLISLLDSLNKIEDLKLIPIIAVMESDNFLDNRLDYSTAVELGIDEFVYFPIDPAIINLRLKNVIGNSKLEMMEKEKELSMAIFEMKKRADHDHLTWLYNRTALENKVKSHFEKSPSSNASFLIIDIDNFKSVNDNLGHIKGDEVLMQMGDILTKHFRSGDVVARLGGDEFCVFISKNPPLAQLKESLQDLCNQMKSHVFDGKFRTDIEISCSIGVCLSPENGTDYKTMYKNADSALLVAKRLGKNRYQIYGDNMDMPSVGIEKNLSALLDDVSDCIFVCDLETYEIYYANETACRWIKASSDNIVGKKCYEIIGGYDSPCPCCINSSILNDHGYHTFEFFSNDTNIEFPSKCKISKWNGCPSRVQIIQNLDNP